MKQPHTVALQTILCIVGALGRFVMFRDEWCCLTGRPACGGAAGPLRWRPVTHSLSREAWPQSVPFTAPVCTHTRALKHTHPLRCQQTRSHTHAHSACTLETRNTHSHADDRELSTLKPFTALVKKGTSVCTSLVCWATGVLDVCVCVCMWVRRLLWAFPPTQSPIPNIDWEAKKNKGWRLRAGSGPESRCSFLTSSASPSPHLQTLNLFTVSSQTFDYPHGKHKSMSRLLGVYLKKKNALRSWLHAVTVNWSNIAVECDDEEGRVSIPRHVRERWLRSRLSANTDSSSIYCILQRH